MNPAFTSAGPFVTPENGNGRAHLGYFSIEEEALRVMTRRIGRPRDYRKAVACYVGAARIANLEGRDEFIRPIQSIANDVGYSYTETIAGLRLLEEVGLLEIVERKEEGSKTCLPSLYRLKRVSPDFRTPSPGNRTTSPGNHAGLRVIQPSSPGTRNFQESPRVPKNSSKNGTNNSSSREEAEEDFDGFWDAYPKKYGKPQALAAWRATPPLSRPSVLAALERQKASEEWRKENGRWVPRAADWLTDERWKDHLPKLHEPVSPRLPTASAALESLRAIFDLRPNGFSDEETALARGYVALLAEADWTFMAESEKERIAEIKIDASSQPGGNASDLAAGDVKESEQEVRATIPSNGTARRPSDAVGAKGDAPTCTEGVALAQKEATPAPSKAVGDVRSMLTQGSWRSPSGGAAIRRLIARLTPEDWAQLTDDERRMAEGCRR